MYAATVRRLSDAKLMDDQEQIQVEMDGITSRDHDPADDAWMANLREALDACNAELIRRGLMTAA